MTRVLFVCIGNTCRSPMAAAFANHYGKDVLTAASAGLMPVPSVDPRTVEVMRERGVDVSAHVPSLYHPLDPREFDIVVNLSGIPLNRTAFHVTWPTVDWHVKDPFRADLDVYREVRDEIEHRVMLFILELRRHAKQPVV